MQSTFIRSETVAEGTMRFYFEKPQGFEFMAGQSIDLTLVNPPETDAEGNMRAFSLASAPHEPELFIATRMRDTAFKRSLKTLQQGAEVAVEGPFGSFNLHQNAARPAIILAGGIGITPFRSMIADAAERKLPHKITLVYSNRRPEDAAFLAELQELATKNPNYTFIGTMTDMANSKEKWEGHTGYIDDALIRAQIPEGSQPIYYIAGPQTMVKAMRDILTKMEISLDDIRTEEFTGY